MKENYFDRYEALLSGDGFPAAIDTFTIESIGVQVRRARFSQGPLFNVEVRQRVATDLEEVLVDLNSVSRWTGLYLEHADGFVTCQTGGLFAVAPDGTFDNKFGLSTGVAQHGPLTIACQNGLMELGLGSLASSLAGAR